MRRSTMEIPPNVSRLVCVECGAPADEEMYVVEDWNSDHVFPLCSKECENHFLDSRAADERED